MYKCHSCGEVFEYADTYKERHPYGMSYAEETIYICPYCKDASVDEAYMCEECGEWFLREELDDGLCEDCISAMEGEC